jgi:hypothetical protein
LTEKPDHVAVHVKYKDVEETLSGTPEQVWLLLDRFFAELLPAFETARKIQMSVDLHALVKESEKIIAFAEEGPYILVPRSQLTDNETLSLLLLANYLGFRLGKTTSESLSKEELQMRLGKNAKITSTRLGELTKNEIAMRTTDQKYRVSTFGIVQMQKDILPKIRSKIGA